MRILLVLLSAALLVGCSSSRNGVSRVDVFDDVRVDQMTGNNVSGAILQRTVVCLNARRETRKVTTATNVSVTVLTNVTVTVVTNQTVSMSTNFYYATATNLAPVQPAPAVAALATDASNATAAPPPETPTALVPTNAPAALSTNFSLTVTRNQSGTASPTQTAANNQFVRAINNQITLTSNNISLSLATNLVVTFETNLVLNYVTNAVISALTNVIVTPTNQLAHDYFLYTELLGPSDFNLQPGESLILLVDGARHGFSPAPSGTAFISRKGFSSTLYKVAPEVLVAIANAREVRLRIKGTSSVIERTLSRSGQKHFRNFLLEHFAAAPEAEAIRDGKKPKTKFPSAPVKTAASTPALDGALAAATH